MKRRAFLKMSVQFPILVAGWRYRWLSSKVTERTGVGSTPYGSGVYGQGSYSGSLTYLPMVAKGGESDGTSARTW